MNLNGHPILRGTLVPRPSGHFDGGKGGRRGNCVVCLTCIKTSLKNVKLLTAEILYLIIIIIIICCNNNFSGKYWAIFGPKFSGPPLGTGLLMEHCVLLWLLVNFMNLTSSLI